MIVTVTAIFLCVLSFLKQNDLIIIMHVEKSISSINFVSSVLRKKYDLLINHVKNLVHGCTFSLMQMYTIHMFVWVRQ